MTIDNIVGIVSALTSLVASICAAVALFQTKKYNKESFERQRKEATIHAYQTLQEQVLDKLVIINKTEIHNVINYKDESKEFLEIYNEYRALIARCEHFAVGVNNNIYDFNVLVDLSGIHLVMLYNKLNPIIQCARSATYGKDAFKNFEILVKELEKRIVINK
jgi:hypothetical protein